QCLYDEHAGHDGMMGEMASEEWLVERDILNGNDAFTRHHFQHAIDQQHRIAMRQPLHDLLDIEFYFWGILHENGVTVIKKKSGPAPRYRQPAGALVRADAGAKCSTEAGRPHCVASRNDLNRETHP